MKENRLVEIPVSDWPKLRDLYEGRKFESAAYSMIQNYIDWLAKDPSIDFAKFYSLNGDWSDGTFLFEDSYLILFDTLDRKGDAGRLFEALCLLDYSEMRLFNGYDSRLQEVVEKVIEHKKLNGNDRLNGSYDLYFLRQEIAVGLTERNLPEGITISPLKEIHADVIDKIWIFRHEGSLDATRKLIKYGRTLGAYTEDRQLVAWIIVQQTGALGLLKVRDDFRRLGIASALVSRLAKNIADMGQDVMTLISDDNLVSKTMFEGIGFKKVEEFSLNWTFEYNYYIMVNTRSDSQDRLLAALQCLDPKAPYQFGGFPHRLRPTIEGYLTQLGVDVDSLLVTTIWIHISREEALKFNTDPPEGITLSTLCQDDIHTINSIWPHRHPGSEKFIGRLVSLNPNVGAYDKDGNLLAWCLKLPTGALGVLHVKDDQKRKGYGNLMVRVLSKKLAEMGTEVIAPVVENNTPSRNMFKKLGFQDVDKTYWLTKPALE